MHRQHKNPPCPCPVECRKMSISSTGKMGRTFHFWHVPGSRPSHQYIFLIHNHQLSILLSLHKCAYCTIFSNHLSQNTPSNTPPNSSHLYPTHTHFLHPLHSILLPPRGTLSLDKSIPKYTPIPSPTYTHKSLTFPSKIPKNSLKSLFFNR